MTASLMDGKSLASEIRSRLREKAAGMIAEGVTPMLATVLVGDDPGSKLYVGNKQKAAAEVGIKSENHTLPADTDEPTLSALLLELNRRSDIHGILLQLPLPRQFKARAMTDKISPEKDVDGLTSTSMGRLFYGQQILIPCTPKGIMVMLHRYGVQVRGSHAVIINRSPLVGKPLYHLMLAEDATVTTCHSKTKDISSFTKEADILVTAAGRRPDFTVTEEMVKEGVVVVDVAMNKLDGRTVGDVDFESVANKASLISPVPGGVGPMTIVMLLENTLIAAASLEKTRTEIRSSLDASA